MLIRQIERIGSKQYATLQNLVKFLVDKKNTHENVSRFDQNMPFLIFVT